MHVLSPIKLEHVLVSSYKAAQIINNLYNDAVTLSTSERSQTSYESLLLLV